MRRPERVRLPASLRTRTSHSTGATAFGRPEQLRNLDGEVSGIDRKGHT
ncbi:hypothetical protein SPURM210S_01568 [Streptomyces purpurascens]